MSSQDNSQSTKAKWQQKDYKLRRKHKTCVECWRGSEKYVRCVIHRAKQAANKKRIRDAAKV